MNHNPTMTGFVRRIRAKLGPRAAILTYHRITDDPLDPYGLCVTPANFRSQLEVIRERFRPIPLDDLAQCTQNNQLPRGAVSLTFDDGYTDNLACAKPMLEEFDIPATVFMTTGSVGREREFWWDELERIFLRPGKCPELLELEIAGQRRTWSLQNAMDYREADMQRDCGWRLTYPGQPLLTADPSPRHRAFREIYSLIQPMLDAERQAVLDQLLQWAKQQYIVRPTHRALNDAGVRELAAGGLITIGAHTVNHTALPQCSEQTQREEINQCKTSLEELLQHEVACFSYPYGQYNASTMELVESAGYRCACACDEQPLRGDAHPIKLPRLEVSNVEGDQFAQWLQARLANAWRRNR